jgi:hypothetical protein
MTGKRIIASGGFNTGRLYTQHGQRIFWAQREDGWLGFVDQDRMISGWIKREEPLKILEAPILPKWLMGKYDHCQYQIGAPEGWNVRTPEDQEYENLRI